MDEYQGAVEWLVDKPRPELSSRLVQKMEGSEIMKSSDNAPRKAASKAKAKSKATNTTFCGIDSFRLCSEHPMELNIKATNRVKTFADVLISSASYVIHLIDKDFAGAASTNLRLVCMLY